MKKIFSIIIVSAAVLLMLYPLAFAKDISMELSLDRDYVEVGDVIQLSLTFNNVQNIPAPQLPEINGFKSQYLGPSTRMSIINSRMSSSVTHRYKLVAVKTGTLLVGPFSFSHQGDTYRSEGRKVTVVDRGQAPRPTQPDSSAAEGRTDIEADLDGRIFLILSAGKTTGYLNERIPVTLKLYVHQLTVRDVQYPTLEGQGFNGEGFERPRQYREELGGKLYDVVEFHTAVYPTKEGQITLGPAALKCNVVVRKAQQRGRSGLHDFFDHDFFDDSFFGDFFGRVQVYPMEVTSPELTFSVLPFPQENRPVDFSGAVGDFQLDVRSAPHTLKAGDPITLTMKVTGRGNFDSVQAPVFVSTDGFKTYEAQVRESEEGKVFEQVIIPQSENITHIPAIRFSFFDPDRKEYLTREQAPVPIEVSPSGEQQAVIIDAAQQGTSAPATTQVLGRDIVYIKENIGRLKKKEEYLYNNRLFLILQCFPLLFFIGILTFQRRKERLTSDIRYARKLRAPKIARVKLKTARAYLRQGNPAAFYDQIFKTLQEYLGHRFNRPSAGITADVVDELGMQGNINKEIGEKLKMCFADCDSARYAAAAFGPDRMQRTLTALEEAIDYLERKKR